MLVDYGVHKVTTDGAHAAGEIKTNSRAICDYLPLFPVDARRFFNRFEVCASCLLPWAKEKDNPLF
ncbi:hypothetical protein BXP70_10265 [Hymenobacter crusticola]|uniref:Uncharacterized protein n=1 Tax=Hymenobacter crusticola TaxID=1770526 RepID=A0A243WEG8_9BACT|nr:hypothetical protein BXP70_10265 [Hymenobacter crusticola]